MKRLIGTNVMAPHVAQLAPAGYVFAPAGYGYIKGRIMPGPYTDTTTTVVLLPEDEGNWFYELVKKAGGTVKKEG